jgi:TPP-dependent pyruvate/acetoin dehydrogenase alpha subunit
VKAITLPTGSANMMPQLLGGAPAEASLSVERAYRSLYLIRRVEEVLADIYPSDKIKSPVHLSIGQEAVSVGVCAALRPDDIVFATYRGHAAYLAKGGNVRGMIAELYGKATGVAGGKAGSMHLIDVAHRVMGMSAIVGTTIPHAAGYAYALKTQRSDAVVVCFLGDGATEEGVFYETLNFAALKHLPVLFVCENNGFAIHSPIAQRQANPDISARAAAMGVPAERLTSDDVFAVQAATADAVAALRRGDGPRFLEVATYRWREHVGPGHDFAAGYRSIEDAQRWFEADQVQRVAALLPLTARTEIEQEVEREIADAVAFAEQSAFPDPKELFTHVYAD